MIVGLAGGIGSGKTLVASMLPVSFHLQWADSIYAGLAAMLHVDETDLRSRATKESPIPWLGVSPRHLLQTIGTEWGRNLIHPDLWVKLTIRRIDMLAAGGHRHFAVCGTRFPNEISAIRSRGGQVWWIDRPGLRLPAAHQSERMVSPEDCDQVIINDGTVDLLRARVMAAWRDAVGVE